METRIELPSLERLDELFYYSRGKLRYKTTKGKNKAGSAVGANASADYASVRIDGRKYKVHRVIWKLVHREEPPFLIDHKSRCKRSNHVTNLRAATKRDNAMNCDHYEQNKPAGRPARRTSKRLSVKQN